MESVEVFTGDISTLLSKLTTVHDTKLQELKINNRSVFDADDHGMQQLIDSTNLVETNYLCAQIREMRSKVSLNCIKTLSTPLKPTKIAIEKEVTDKKSQEEWAEQSTAYFNKLFNALLKEMKKNSSLRVNKLYKVDAMEGCKLATNQNKEIQNMNIRQVIKT